MKRQIIAILAALIIRFYQRVDPPMLTKRRATQIREIMKLLCWPIAIILVVLGHVDAGLTIAALGEFGSGAASRLSR